VAGEACDAVVDVAMETPSASFCDIFPTAAFGEDGRGGKRGGRGQWKQLEQQSSTGGLCVVH